MDRASSWRFLTFWHFGDIGGVVSLLCSERVHKSAAGSGDKWKNAVLLHEGTLYTVYPPKAA